MSGLWGDPALVHRTPTTGVTDDRHRGGAAELIEADAEVASGVPDVGGKVLVILDVNETLLYRNWRVREPNPGTEARNSEEAGRPHQRGRTKLQGSEWCKLHLRLVVKS